MIEIFGLLASVLAVVGAALNNRKLIWCFPLWAVSNAMSAAIHISAGPWSLAWRDVIFLALAAHGWWSWRSQKNNVWDCGQPPSLKGFL